MTKTLYVKIDEENISYFICPGNRQIATEVTRHEATGTFSQSEVHRAVLHAIHGVAFNLGQLVGKDHSLYPASGQLMTIAGHSSHLPLAAQEEQAWKLWCVLARQAKKSYTARLKTVKVKGYTRKDGKVIADHLRSAPGYRLP